MGMGLDWLTTPREQLGTDIGKYLSRRDEDTGA